MEYTWGNTGINVGQRVCSHSGSEFGDLSSEEEEMIDAGCDPVVESADTRYGFEITLSFLQKYMQRFLIMIFNV